MTSIWYGVGHPSLALLMPFVMEMQHVSNNGILCEGIGKLPVLIVKLVCDALARALILGMTGIQFIK